MNVDEGCFNVVDFNFIIIYRSSFFCSSSSLFHVIDVVCAVIDADVWDDSHVDFLISTRADFVLISLKECFILIQKSVVIAELVTLAMVNK